MGSLALRHLEDRGVTLRYRFFIHDVTSGFVQWGQVGDECHPEWNDPLKAFGPDVQVVRNNSQPEKNIGIFGLSHRELLQSRWVNNDTLTVKIELHMRLDLEVALTRKRIATDIDLPKPALQENLLSLLHSGKYCDVTFVVGE